MPSGNAPAALRARREIPALSRHVHERAACFGSSPAPLTAALTDGRNQYPPMTGIAELRAVVAATDARIYGPTVDAQTEVVVTSGATEAITACLMALLDWGDEVADRAAL